MKLFCALTLLLACGLVAAHSGGTDAQGCYTNRKTGVRLDGHGII